MHNIIAPILGFEEYKTIDVSIFDCFFSTLVFDKEKNICMSIVNVKYLNNIHLDLEDEVFNVMDITPDTLYDIYFIMVLQDPIENSVLNLAAPIIINHDEKSVGQFIPANNKLFNTCTIKRLCPSEFPS